MFAKLETSKSWSQTGFRCLTWSIGVTAFLSIVDGVMRGPIAASHLTVQTSLFTMVSVWVSDFRFLFEQGLYASTIFLVGAKFFETRTIMTVGFDRSDASKMVLKGVDQDNIVWIGRRYGTTLEAEVVAAAIAERLKESEADVGFMS